MGKVKLKNISNSKINKICKEQKNCIYCPLKRMLYDKQGTLREVMCYKRARALFYADKTYYEELLKMDLSDREREYHEAMWEETQATYLEMMEEEVELNE